MMARIRDAENTQCVAELTQKISSLEYKVPNSPFLRHCLWQSINVSLIFQNQEILTEGDLASSCDHSDKVREMQDKIANLRAQVINRGCSSRTAL